MKTILVIVGIVLFTLFSSCILFVVSEDLRKKQAFNHKDGEEFEMKKVIRYGAEGKEVAEIQELLQLAGSKIKADGKFTIGMISAVKSFQKKNGLPVTGEVDLKTMNKLKTYAKPVKKPAVKKSTTKKTVK